MAAQGLYTPNEVLRVPYKIRYLHPSFDDYLNHTYGARDKALVEWCSLVTTGEGDHKAYSLPSGGRVLVYQLPEPFLVPISGEFISEVDVKGVLLTNSGYHYRRDELIGDRKEVMRHKNGEDLFGPEELENCLASVENMEFVRARGFKTPIPLVVLEPEYLIYEGLPITFQNLRQLFGIKSEKDFGLLIRGYSGSSARLSDFNQWGSDYITPSNSPDMAVILRNGRGLFDGCEMAQGTPVDQYLEFEKICLRELALYFMWKISPSSGKEAIPQLIHHTHLHNHLISGSIVEWVPITSMAKLTNPHDHILELIDDNYDAVVNFASLVLRDASDIQNIPNIHDYLVKLQSLLKDRVFFTDQILAEYTPNGRHQSRGEILRSHLQMV